MSNLLHKAKAFMQDEEGLSVVEYVVGAALLVVALGLVFNNLGTNLQTKLDGAVGSGS
ncbi:Flp family type IVb pilin [Vibrio vulnificus]|uniref:Flp family type IVb pilin n=1 Tax=Vibrio vulnificus TaxID=672 RepID=UPI0003057077|nr:Flp family type IVb pilin [Vibrio vulnificus]EHU5002935.1 Flp family type IVb pilin [Vibrio vulnificus]EID4418858.1 Flp family type IVb pilin [Vibrio vulnificus]EJO9872906.1 Flp family type IVb pilin [Vibrio vulnificus]EJS4043062.1 Flp family type IVb pilin [Vibrio vulnificus]ELH9601061.1 Flp family type IVb pilin [Vibrio vulnificus]